MSDQIILNYCGWLKNLDNLKLILRKVFDRRKVLVCQ